MAAKEKYASVLSLGEQLGVQNGRVEEQNGILRVWGTVQYGHEKDQLWDAIKAVGGAEPADIIADIAVETSDYYAKYTVVSGDTLGKISKHFFGEPGKYMQIFNANKGVLSNPDLIEVGQELVIPFEQ